jgi:hypothetical protein
VGLPDLRMMDRYLFRLIPESRQLTASLAARLYAGRLAGGKSCPQSL